MKLLLISFSINGAMGDFYKGIIENLSNEYDVFLLTNSKFSTQNLKFKGICSVPFDRTKIFDFINLKSYYNIFKFLKRTKFDSALFASPHIVNIMIFFLIPHNKRVVYLHDHQLHSGVQTFDKWILKAVYFLYYRYSNKIIVSCNKIKSDIINKKLISDPYKIHVVYLGLLKNLCTINKSFKVPIFDVLFFGRIEYYKGLDILVKAGEQLPNIRFVIAGKGNLEHVFGIKKLPENFIHINKYIPDEDLASIISHAKVVVLPYRDATGTQTIQSVFFFKKPIVATNVGCFPEYITDGKDGLIIEASNVKQLRKAIIRILSNDHDRILMGEEGFRKIKKEFSDREILVQFNNVFKNGNH